MENYDYGGWLQFNGRRYEFTTSRDNLMFLYFSLDANI